MRNWANSINLPELNSFPVHLAPTGIAGELKLNPLMLRCKVSILHHYQITKPMKPDELPDMNVSGLVTLSDFYAHQHEVIETALKNA